MTSHPLPSSSQSSAWTSWSLLGLLVVLLAYTGWAYSQAFTGTWYFDDAPNLEGLAKVNDWLTGLDFIASGIAGPTGRPLALATFVPQAAAWPDDPGAFLRVNAAIHLLNGLLVFAVASLLGRILRPNNPRVPWFALAVAACWTLNPFLASASWMVVQRMTLLAGTFMLAGLILYLLGRVRVARAPWRGWTLMIAGAAGGTLLATYSKENGALLPLLILIVEVLLLRPALSEPDRRWRPWILAMLALPSALILFYLGQRLVDGGGFATRPFDLTERLLTQARVLWNYVYHLLAPHKMAVTPFTDGYPLSTGLLAPPSTALAIAGLVGVVGLAVWARNKTLIPLFGVAWFLGAHLLESSVIPLELYFAHRNYIPAFGLFFALLHGLFFSAFAERWRRAISLGVVGYAVLMGWVLFATAALWGNPRLAAEQWQQRYPDSVRAADFLVNQYLAAGELRAADRVLREATVHNPDNPRLILRTLFMCDRDPADYRTRFETARVALAETRGFSPLATGALHQLALISSHRECPHLHPAQVRVLVEILVEDPRYLGNTMTRQRLAYTQAQIAHDLGDMAEALRHLKTSFQAIPQIETATLIAYHYAIQGQRDEARRFLQAVLDDPPVSAIQAILWRRELGNYLEKLNP